MRRRAWIKPYVPGPAPIPASELATLFIHRAPLHQGVLSDDGAWIETTARIRDELEDGDNVWIDVGDGMP